MFEIEIKSLLGGEEKAKLLRQRLDEIKPEAKLVSKHKQLNHYFVGDSRDSLHAAVSPLLSEEASMRLKKILNEAKELSVRTRQADNKVLFVVKASVDDTTSANGISRVEFEEEVDKSLSELDQVLLDAGFSYQSKWSREREEYTVGETSVTVDKNAGYGYVAELERTVSDKAEAEEAKTELRNLMERLGLEELPQDRLERMFTYYNEHWPEYYGTDNIFVVD